MMIFFFFLEKWNDDEMDILLSDTTIFLTLGY